MTIKVNYDTETTLVKGYYPSSINYTSIPEPFIEIKDDAQVLDKQMCVVNGVYQEYIKPFDVQLQEAKDAKIAQCQTYLNKTDWQAVRLAETGEPMKEGVLENRALARSNQALITSCTTLGELNNINTNF